MAKGPITIAVSVLMFCGECACQKKQSASWCNSHLALRVLTSNNLEFPPPLPQHTRAGWVVYLAGVASMTSLCNKVR